MMGLLISATRQSREQLDYSASPPGIHFRDPVFHHSTIPIARVTRYVLQDCGLV